MERNQVKGKKGQGGIQTGNTQKTRALTDGAECQVTTCGRARAIRMAPRTSSLKRGFPRWGVAAYLGGIGG